MNHEHVTNTLADLANDVTELEVAIMDGDLPAEVLDRVNSAAERAKDELAKALEIFP